MSAARHCTVRCFHGPRVRSLPLCLLPVVTRSVFPLPLSSRRFHPIAPDSSPRLLFTQTVRGDHVALQLDQSISVTMPANLHDQGEQLILDAAFGGRTIDVGPYNDSTNALSDSATYSSITTEPAGSAYAVQSATGPTVSLNSGTSAVDLGSLSFDVSDSSQSVDALHVRDSSSGDLIFINTLDSTYDLSSINTLDLSNGGMTLD